MSYFKYPISDAHIHAFNEADIAGVRAMADELGYEKFCMLSAASVSPRFADNNRLCAEIKLRSPGRCYAFAALHYPPRGLPGDMLEQARLLYDLGFDGIKMMDGKPDIRRRIGIPLDDPALDPFFSFLEKHDIPLLYHVNDPDEFWHWDQMPDWAKKNGRILFYGDGRHQEKRHIENEALGILKKHPALRVTFAHFFFTSGDLERTAALFDAYPNMNYDITPGWEMFENFAAHYEDARAFFDRYAARIMYGTDTISDHWHDTVRALRRVLETDEQFIAFEERCHGLALEEATLRAIYKKTFDRWLPAAPRPMDQERIHTLVA